ncbi:MAG TPA: hypothetical protein VLT83_13720 [Opitutaceae bacterium]|nr:hypothetical protein [Opitutaceae bacterium]
MSAIYMPAAQPVSVSRYLVLAIPALLLASAILSTPSIDRGSPIPAEATAVEPSPSGMF